MTGRIPSGIVFVLVAALLWGTTGTAAALAPGVGPLAIGAAAMGIGGLLQAAAASRAMVTHRGALTAHWRTVMLSAGAVAVFPLAFYSSMRLAGVAAGTVVSIGSAPPAAAVIERIVDHQPLSRRWAVGTAVGVSGVLALALGRPGRPGGATTTAAAQPVLGIALGLLAGCTYALYSWGAARVMRRGLPSRPVMGAVFGLGGLLLLPVLALTGAPIITSGSHLAVVAYLATVPMFLGYVLFGRGLATVTASTATTASLLEPAAAAVIAVSVLREHLPPMGWLGLGLLFASLVITATNTRPAATGPLRNRPTVIADRAVCVTLNADVEPV
jgi:DME family drug/metabolite transporter